MNNGIKASDRARGKAQVKEWFDAKPEGHKKFILYLLDKVNPAVLIEPIEISIEEYYAIFGNSKPKNWVKEVENTFLMIEDSLWIEYEECEVSARLFNKVSLNVDEERLRLNFDGDLAIYLWSLY